MLIKRIILCAFILWILSVFAGFVFMFLSRNKESSTISIAFTAEATSVITTLSYDVNVSANDSLEVTNLSGLADQAVTTNLRVKRAAHASLLLPDGKVLVNGGFHETDTLRSTKIYDPPTDTWRDTGPVTEK
ncbi:unnamed protein product [Adineta ricciae]|uniref:Uncharacterized protein n=1 Tax=Adineta ricciae TaxID=249248 RepID=A0A815P559_ADIRI|nr:unnamed protein product [Adineta ricciae]